MIAMHFLAPCYRSSVLSAKYRIDRMRLRVLANHKRAYVIREFAIRVLGALQSGSLNKKLQSKILLYTLESIEAFEHNSYYFRLVTLCLSAIIGDIEEE